MDHQAIGVHWKCIQQCNVPQSGDGYINSLPNDFYYQFDGIIKE